ncbi:MAG: hypothetical protein PHC90_05575 [Syntrophorhabdaceae bacterium]|nr:hypothetical protein [Syntrophorhabdaceae bacterium]
MSGGRSVSLCLAINAAVLSSSVLVADPRRFLADLYVSREDRKTPDEAIIENTRMSFLRKVMIKMSGKSRRRKRLGRHTACHDRLQSAPVQFVFGTPPIGKILSWTMVDCQERVQWVMGYGLCCL